MLGLVKDLYSSEIQRKIGTRIQIEESELILLLQKQEKVGFDYLYDHYSAALMGIALRIVEDKDSAEEIVHDTFMKIWNSIEGYESDKGRLFTWMARICKNCSLDHVKSKNFKKNLKTDGLSNVVVDRETGLREHVNTDTIGVKEWMNVLPPEQKAVFQALYFEGMSQSQAAEELEIPLGTVKTRLRMGLIEIRKKLGVS
jgi:RNA polymerase sigma-70 factor (ECF subfamily)